MNEKLKTIKIIHIGLIIGLSLAYYFIGDLQSLNFSVLTRIDGSSFIYMLIPLAAFYIGNLLFTNQLKGVSKQLPLEEKLASYQTAALIRWSLLEGAAFYILFAAQEYLLFGILIIIYMIYLRPTEESIKRDFDRIS